MAISHVIPNTVKLIELPDIRQNTDSTCGAAAILAVCQYFGIRDLTESHIVVAARMTIDEGSDPRHLRRAAQHYGLLMVEHYGGMTDDSLRAALDASRPVLIMLQAWGDAKEIKQYATTCTCGHWVVAIGYDAEGWYFEDPWLKGTRGFLSFSELSRRWHDVGERSGCVHRYGLTLWKPRARRIRIPIRRWEPIP